jgi:hypothetical protein
MMLIVHVEQRVFLRTTDNHSSNNVGDTHGRKCSEENQEAGKKTASANSAGEQAIKRCGMDG